MKVSGMLVDVHERAIYAAEIFFENGKITEISKVNEAPRQYILPGLIDSHIHIESSMVTPGAFAGAAVSHGTTSVISDPHEIANVLGIEGVEFMISDARKVPVKFWFGAPSCVPATAFESAGAVIDSNGIEQLLSLTEVKYLSEMMNFPGVIYGDKEVLKKISIARKLNKPVDGHAPGLTGEPLEKYVSAGISTDHECSTLSEAREKISLGMKILIREGSAARNLNALKSLLKSDPEMIMLCSDDLHPEMLVKGHINRLIAALIKEGYNLFDVIRACTLNPVLHYGIDAGLLKKGQSADFIVVKDYREMNVLETWIEGEKVFDRGKVLFKYERGAALNNFNCSEISEESVAVSPSSNLLRVIVASDGELLTKQIVVELKTDGNFEGDITRDILKIIVKDRYNDSPPAIGFINGIGLRRGAYASSVAHDSHNIICVGTNDSDIVRAVNEIVRLEGGLAVADEGKISSLELNIGGIMSDSSCSGVAEAYEDLSVIVKQMGSRLKAPFMTLSFMALLVIPELKLSDKGLFNGTTFSFTSLFV